MRAVKRRLWKPVSACLSTYTTNVFLLVLGRKIRLEEFEYFTLAFHNSLFPMRLFYLVFIQAALPLQPLPVAFRRALEIANYIHSISGLRRLIDLLDREHRTGKRARVATDKEKKKGGVASKGGVSCACVGRCSPTILPGSTNEIRPSMPHSRFCMQG